jgi:hypothetical protein|nr:MAG TPA: hypothetical protein [Caudoviricetes sp.]
MLDSLSILNIENFKRDIIFYIYTIVYETWWTSKHFNQKYYEVADIYNISVLALADFKHSDYLKLGSISYTSIYYYIIDCSNKKMLTDDEKKYIGLSILYYNKYKQDKNLTGIIIKEMRRDNGLL